MASARRSLQDIVGDITECSICTESMVDPRQLPCIHTFCFKCLDLLWKDEQPGVKVLCPLCRAEVVLPVNGVPDLPKNFFLEKLVEAKNLNFSEARCQTHKDKEIDIYCMECEVAVCTICFTTKHNRHECSDIQRVAEDLKKRIKSNIEDARGIVVEVNKQSIALEKLLMNFDLSVKETQSQIIQAGEQMKQLIVKHVRVLLKELNDERARKIREFELVKEELLVQTATLESFIKYSETILEKAVPADVASVSKDLSVSFQSLKQSKITRIDGALEVIFIPNNLRVHEDDRNFIGKIKLNEHVFVSNSRKSVSYDQDPKLHTSIPFSWFVRGIAASGDQLYVVISGSNEVTVFNSTTLALQSSIPVNGLSEPCDIAANENSLFVGGNGRIYRVELRDKSITSWPVCRDSWTTGISVNKLGHVIVVIRKENKLNDYTPVGELLREIALSHDFDHPYRAIKMENDQFLVCQAGGILHRVCLIDNKGNLIKSFGSTEGSGNANLTNPYDFTIDRENCVILVADYENCRVVLLNTQLEYVKDLIPACKQLGKITIVRLFIDENYGRLYVSSYNDKRLVSIFDLEH